MKNACANLKIVLVVEDDPLIRYCVVAELEQQGFGVIEAPDAQAALLHFEGDESVAVVFSDINMPGPFDGLSLAHKIAQLRPGVRLILTSGRGCPAVRDMPIGVEFFPKPYDLRSVSMAVAAA
jgi:DNA-binding NtrC family response regulator